MSDNFADYFKNIFQKHGFSLLSQAKLLRNISYDILAPIDSSLTQEIVSFMHPDILLLFQNFPQSYTHEHIENLKIQIRDVFLKIGIDFNNEQYEQIIEIWLQALGKNRIIPEIPEERLDSTNQSLGKFILAGISLALVIGFLLIASPNFLVASQTDSTAKKQNSLPSATPTPRYVLLLNEAVQSYNKYDTCINCKKEKKNELLQIAKNKYNEAFIENPSNKEIYDQYFQLRIHILNNLLELAEQQDNQVKLKEQQEKQVHQDVVQDILFFQRDLVINIKNMQNHDYFNKNRTNYHINQISAQNANLKEVTNRLNKIDPAYDLVKHCTKILQVDLNACEQFIKKIQNFK